jgi:hypothetical protein
VALADGGFVVLGSFEDSVRLAELGFGGESGKDGFVATFDPDGALRCGVHLSTADGYLYPEDLAVHGDGAIEVVGHLDGQVVLDGFPATSLDDDGLYVVLDPIPQSP